MPEGTSRSLAAPLRIGLTGGIGSGKSSVAKCFADHGAVVIDSDAIARQLTEPGGAAIEALRREFGTEFIAASGALDRDRMRALAFSDASAKQRLEQILHPMIAAETAARSAQSPHAVKVFDVPLLVESGHWRRRVDRVCVVDCREQTQIERVVRRSGWSAESVRAVLDRQASRAQRRAAADDVIFNDGIGLDQLARQVEELWQRLCT